jgi:hypothetical protein
MFRKRLACLRMSRPTCGNGERPAGGKLQHPSHVFRGCRTNHNRRRTRNNAAEVGGHTCPRGFIGKNLPGYSYSQVSGPGHWVPRELSERCAGLKTSILVSSHNPCGRPALGKTCPTMASQGPNLPQRDDCHNEGVLVGLHCYAEGAGSHTSASSVASFATQGATEHPRTADD